MALDKEIEEENRRKRLLLRSTLGTGTLLKGLTSGGGIASFSGTTFAPRSAAGGGRARTTTLLGGGSTGGGGIAGTFAGGGGRAGSAVRTL